MDYISLIYVWGADYFSLGYKIVNMVHNEDFQVILLYLL